MRSRTETAITSLEVAAYKVPTDTPEADGTLRWDATTLVTVHAHAGGQVGLGYTYADASAAHLISGLLANVILGSDSFDVPAAWCAMLHATRNAGRPGIASMAIAAVDSALWDLKARILNLPLVDLLGAVREAVEIYGSGGFTSYSVDRLQKQLEGWVELGIRRVKMKIGSQPDDDLDRVRAAREAIGPDVELFVDANGAYSVKQALAQAERFVELGVSWFEEPVSSDNLTGLRLIRERGPAGMNVAAGEYGFDLPYFRRMLEAGAVDVLQADATRCAGITGFLQAGAVCAAFGVPLSAHCAPALHLHAGCAIPALCHLEYFHDHTRIDEMLFDGVVTPTSGRLHPDRSKPGMGLELKHAEARRHVIWKSDTASS